MFFGAIWYNTVVRFRRSREIRRCDRTEGYIRVSNEKVLKISDVAALLKVGLKTVYTMAQNQELPAFKVRGQWRFTRQDIEEWIERQKQAQRSTDVPD